MNTNDLVPVCPYQQLFEVMHGSNGARQQQQSVSTTSWVEQYETINDCFVNITRYKQNKSIISLKKKVVLPFTVCFLKRCFLSWDEQIRV